MKKFDLLIFDLDGTLVDTARDIFFAVNYALQKHNLNKTDEISVINSIGDGAKQLFEKVIPPEMNEKIDSIVEAYFEYYSKHLLDNTHLYSDVENILCHYNNKLKVVISNKTHKFTKIILKELNIIKHFRIVLGATVLEKNKPDPLPLNFVMHKLKIKPENTIIIGDGINDILAGKNAGVKVCSVTYGYTKKEKLLEFNPDYIIDSIAELKNIIY